VTNQGERCNYALGDQHAIYYQPETLIDYGLSRHDCPRVKIDTNLFYYDYKNLQLSAIVPVNGANQTITTNAGRHRCWAGNSRRSSPPSTTST
jgi:iron complex outermembrane receptor protein